MIRNAWVRKTSGVRTDHITRAANGMQKRRLETLVDFGPQTRDVNIDDIGLGVKIVFPDIFQKHGPGHDLPGMPHQIFEQTKLASLKLDGRPPPLDRA